MSIDAHCHIDLHPDPSALVESAIAAKLQVVAVTTTPAAFKISSTFADEENGILPALGMHPEVVGERPNDVSLFHKYLGQVRWVGEIGLDGSRRFRDSLKTQKAVFEQILRECSDAGGRIMSIHSRSASSEVLRLLNEHTCAGIPVFHWFSGSLRDVEAGLKLGGYFSVNGKMLQSKSGQSIAKQIPLQRLLTESDAPFASPPDVSIVDQIRECEIRLAEILDCEVGHVQQTISQNFHGLSNLP